MTDPDSTPSEPHAEHGLRVAVLGATGLVGREMTRLLEESRVPVRELLPLASAPRDRTVAFAGEDVPVRGVTREVFDGVDLVLASAGGDVSREWLPIARDAGCVCVDNTSAFRMHDDVPLVVPEVNAHVLDDVQLGESGAIIANPNCSTIQLVVALEPLRRAFGLEGVVVSTYQSISGAGLRAVDEFRAATTTIMDAGESGHEVERDAPAFDVRAKIGDFEDDGHTSEEWKMIRETPKILGTEVPVDVTCVRVPVFTGHAESVVVHTRDAVDVASVEQALASFPGIRLHDRGAVPSPREAAGDTDVHVGRVRPLRTADRGIQFWVVADNLLKGAAWNAIQIAEHLAATRRPQPAGA